MINSIYITLTIFAVVVAAAGPIAAIALFVFVPLTAGSIVMKLIGRFLGCAFCIVAVVFVVSSLASYWIGREGSFARGEAAAIAGIAREDTRLITKARTARSKLKDCEARNMTWVQSTGECR